MILGGWDEPTSISASIIFAGVIGIYARLKWLQAKKAGFKQRHNYAEIFAGLSMGLVILSYEPASEVLPEIRTSVLEGILTASIVGFGAAGSIMLIGVIFNHLFEAECPDLTSQEEVDRYRMGAAAAISGGCWLYLAVKFLAL